jgi:hypothetical protein
MLKYITSNYYFGLEHEKKLLIATGFIVTSLIANSFLQYRIKTSKKGDPEYIAYVKEVRYDLLKYLLIESAIIITEIIETGKFNIVTSIARICFIHISLIVFHSFKKNILGSKEKH